MNRRLQRGTIILNKCYSSWAKSVVKLWRCVWQCSWTSRWERSIQAILISFWLNFDCIKFPLWMCYLALNTIENMQIIISYVFCLVFFIFTSQRSPSNVFSLPAKICQLFWCRPVAYWLERNTVDSLFPLDFSVLGHIKSDNVAWI